MVRRSAITDCQSGRPVISPSITTSLARRHTTALSACL
jgi:hypothetical protein